MLNKKIAMSSAISITILAISSIFFIGNSIKNTQTINTNNINVGTKTQTKIETKTNKEENKNEFLSNINENDKQVYTLNLSTQRMKNGTFFIRNDGWAPHYLEKFSTDNPYYPALYGYVVNEYNIEFNEQITDYKQLRLKLENHIGYSIKNIEQSGSTGILVSIEGELNTNDINTIQNRIASFKNVVWSDMNSGILPEYDNNQYYDIISNSMIPENQ